MVPHQLDNRMRMMNCAGELAVWQVGEHEAQDACPRFLQPQCDLTQRIRTVAGYVTWEALKCCTQRWERTYRSPG
jgi:hypothetical protein